MLHVESAQRRPILCFELLETARAILREKPGNK